MLANVDGALLRASVRLDGASDTERNGNDQGESDNVSVLGDPRERRAARSFFDELSVERSVLCKRWDVDELIVPVENHDVRRIEDTEETNTIHNLLGQYQIEVFASRFALRQHRPHRERNDAHWGDRDPSIPATEADSNNSDEPWQKNAVIQST